VILEWDEAAPCNITDTTKGNIIVEGVPYEKFIIQSLAVSGDMEITVDRIPLFL